MGKAGKWLRNFLPGRRSRDKAGAAPAAAADPGDLALALALPVAATATTTPASTPGAKEKRRWSFRRPAASPGPGSAAAKDARLAPYGFLEPRVDPDQHAVAVGHRHRRRGRGRRGGQAGGRGGRQALRVRAGVQAHRRRHRGRRRDQDPGRLQILPGEEGAVRAAGPREAAGAGARPPGAAPGQPHAALHAGHRRRAEQGARRPPPDARGREARPDAAHDADAAQLAAPPPVPPPPGRGGGEREDRGGGHGRRRRRRVRGARHAAHVVPAQQLLRDAAVPDAVQERAVPEGLADAVRAHGRQRAHLQRPLRRLLLRHGAGQPVPLRAVQAAPAAAPAPPARRRRQARGGGPPAARAELHGEHGVVARQGAVAERAAAAAVGVVGVGRRGGGGVAARRAAQGVAGGVAGAGDAGRRARRAGGAQVRVRVRPRARAAVPVAGQRARGVPLGRQARPVERVGARQRVRVHQHRLDRRHHHVLLVAGHRQRRHGLTISQSQEGSHSLVTHIVTWFLLREDAKLPSL